ncbi:hypothetical protein GGS23DRAFT_548756 [Durotheca rogersii]|uniref:uncharacterized protein n=1 Tax=Durotheca rogersii TaxID=419775 RepID=UPI00221FF47C|nr:uncharacterized protein GGS23DRAFT_548756 [Durotheca rogersii]KAI5867532.1 hypothetical protein GGS23DRAFT_548756 [Durotheca rogersii]
MDSLFQDQVDMNTTLQGSSLEELQSLAQVYEDEPFQDGQQNWFLSSIYFFLFLRTSNKSHLDQAIRKANSAIAATPSDHPERAAQLSKLGFTLIHSPASLPHAALLDFVEVVQMLLEQGAEIDGKDEDGGTALYYAAQYGHEAVAHLLVFEYGASIDMKVNGVTPLIAAAGHGHEAVVRLLLSDPRINVAILEAEDKDGDTALVSAACNGHKAVVQLLLEKGAFVGANGTNGTALQWALRNGHTEVVELLLKKKGVMMDMKDDTLEVLQNIAEGQLLEKIEEAQKLMFPTSSIESWAQNLRFVVAAENPDYDFELIENNRDQTTSEPYVAISYRWRYDANPVRRRIRVPCRNQPGNYETIGTTAPLDILSRGLEFAAAKGIRKIWIDQECIYQNDPEDKQKGIQSMHLVYRNAAVTLVVMDCHVQTLQDVHAIPGIRQFGVHEELRERIVGDRWFTRAWTIQELSSSPPDNLAYLIGWEDGVDVSGEAWEFEATAYNIKGEHRTQSVRRAWELDHSQIVELIHMKINSAMTANLAGNPLFGTLDPSEIVFILTDDNIESMHWWVRMGSLNRESRRTPSTVRKFNMSIPAAFTLLIRKGCTLSSDKLAIIGNLVDCPYRIDIESATKANLTFSTCIIALALYNGDLSPLLGERTMAEWAQRASSKTDTEFPSGHLASWLPFDEIPLNMLLQGQSPHTRFRSQLRNGSKCIVLNRKIVVKGLLWDIEPFHELDCLRDDILKQEQSGEARNREEHASRFFLFLFQLLVRRLLTLGRRDILELIVSAVMGRQFRSPNEIFYFMSELEEWFHGEGWWPAHIAKDTFLTKKPTPRMRVAINATGEERGLAYALTYTDAKGVDIALLRMSEPPTEMSNTSENNRELAEDRPIIAWIYNAIRNGLPLALGKCNIGEETLVSIFTFDPAKHRTVFTPLSELEYEFGKNPWIHLQPKDSFWCVRVCKDKVSEIDMQKAREKLGDTEDGVGTGEIYVSDQILEVDGRATKNERVYGVWSPRLSRFGMLTREQETKSWKQVPLDQAALYYWLR